MTAESIERLEEAVLRHVTETLGIGSEFVSRDSRFGELGFDSVSLLELSRRLNEALGIDLDAPSFFDYPTPRELATFIARRYLTVCAAGCAPVSDPVLTTPDASATEMVSAASTTPPTPIRTATPTPETTSGAPDAALARGVLEPIAIIGISGRFPGAADIDALWSNLIAERCSVGEVPPDRWDWREAAAAIEGTHEKEFMKWGGFMEGVAEFDPEFFGISPREAETMDPHQRLLMMHTWKALEAAGYPAESFSGTRAAVFLAAGGPGYPRLIAEARRGGDEFAPTGGASLAPNRISYLLNLRGPSEAVSTTCASSLVAVHRAILALNFDECTLAIAGGVNTMLTPDEHIGFGGAGMLSQDGLCRSFGAGANGYVRGEGVGVLVLKKLRDAERDGDFIHAVLRGSAENHGGRASSLTAPNPNAQAQLLKDAFRRAGVDPSTIGYIEAHGTGTSLGDPVEISGLVGAFSGNADGAEARAGAAPHCGLGSIKSNIGHLELAAGVAGVIKVILQLQHRTLVRSLHCENINPYIRLQGTPFYLVQQTQPWEPMQDAEGRHLPRRAGVSSFSIGGLNAHVVIEEYVPHERAQPAAPSPLSQMFLLSARDEARLAERVKQLLAAIDAKGWTDADLPSIAYTLQVGRQPMDVRLGLIARSVVELREGLTVALSGKTPSPSGAWICRGKIARRDPVISQLNEDGVLHHALQGWLVQGKLSKILQLWVNGLAVDWSALRDGVRPRRIPLPTYPFSTQRYWVTDQPARAALAPIGTALSSVGTTVCSIETEEAPKLPDAETLLFQRVWRESAPKSGGYSRWKEHWVLLDPALREHASLLEEHGLSVELLPGDAESIETSFGARSEALFARLKGILQRKEPWPLLLQVVCHSDTSNDIFKGSLAGLLTSASLENPLLATQIIQTDAVSPIELLERVKADATDAAHREVRYTAGRRSVAQFVELATPNSATPWKSRGVYLITGGAGGLGRLLAREIMARTEEVRLILSGRSEPTPQLVESLRSLEANGAHIEYRSVDVESESAVEDCVAGIVRDFGKLDGVIHAAGLGRSAWLSEKTSADLHGVLAPKVRGTLNLDRATARLPLDFFILYSSISGTLGARTHSDYALANAFLDRFAHYRDELVKLGQRSGRSLAIDWPVWEGGGMQPDPEILRKMHARGIGTLDAQHGFAALYRCYGTELCQVTVLRGVRSELETLIEVHRSESEPRTQVRELQTPVDRGQLAHRTLLRLKGLLAELTRLGIEKLDAEEALANFGVNSIMLVRLNQKLGQVFQGLSKTLLYEHPNLASLRDFLVETQPERCAAWTGIDAGASAGPGSTVASTSDAAPAMTKSPSMATPPSQPTAASAAPVVSAPPRAREPIAIIGISARFPHAEGLTEYWDNLKNGRDCVSEIPSERWSLTGFFEPDPDEALRSGRSYCKWGGFLKAPACPDPLFFNISPREAANLDPQELLFLETAWSLLEEKGYTKALLRQLFQRKVGVYVGATHGHAGHDADSSLRDVFAATGARSSVPNRVSHFLDLTGPSVAVDTMCSSAATAIYMACKDLQLGECEVAIAGGINLLTEPGKYVGLSRARMAASSANCRSFGRGDGYIPAEAVGAVLLKPLSRAIADGDRVLAVIRAAVSSHSGCTSAYFAPNPTAQAELLGEAFRKAGVDARTISYVEAAANGSSSTDTMEVVALTRAFRKHTQDRAFCRLGSVKSNMGHAEAASAISQLTKVVLQFRHGQLAPTLTPGPINEDLALADSPFRLQETLEDWQRPQLEIDGKLREVPRRALVNSFGAGGSYVTLLLEEPPATEETSSVDPDPCDGTPQIIALSARTPDRLAAVLGRLRDHLDANPDLALIDLAHTLQVGRTEMPVRWATVATSRADVMNALGAGIAWLGSGAAAPAGSLYADLNETSAAREALIAALDEAAVRALVSEGDLPRIASLWTQGVSIPWSLLRATAGGRRVALPTYPFACAPLPKGEQPNRASVQDSPADASPVFRPLLAAEIGLPVSGLKGAQRLGSLGVNSIAAVRLRHLLERAVRNEVPLEVLHPSRTVDEIEADVQALRLKASAGRTELTQVEIVPDLAARHEPFALTEMQESFLAGRLLKMGGDTVGAHIYTETETAELDVHRLNAAWNRVVARHEMLRAVILAEGTQKILKDVPTYRFKVTDLRRRTQAETSAHLEAVRTQMSQRVFGTDSWPLFEIRVSVCRDRYVIHFAIDELVIDGTGLFTLMHEWEGFYTDPDRAIPPLTLSFRDYVLAMKRFEDSPRYRSDVDYWMSELAQMPPGPALKRNAGDLVADAAAPSRIRLAASLSNEIWDRLKAMAVGRGASPTALLLTAFSELLRRWTGDQRFSLLMTVSSRLPVHAEIENIIAPLMSTCIFRVDETESRAFGGQLKGVQERLWRNLEHAAVGGVRILRELKTRREISGAVALPVVFTSYLRGKNDAWHKPRGALFGAGNRFGVNATPQVYLDHQVIEREGRLDLSWDICVAHWGGERLARAAFAAYCEALAELSRLDPDTDFGRLWHDCLEASPPDPPPPGSDMDRGEGSFSGQLVLVQEPAARHEPFPLTDQQQAYLFGRTQYAGGGGHGARYYGEFEAADLDVLRLEQAWKALLSRHDMLRTRILPDGTQQLPSEEPTFAVRVENLVGQPAAARDARLEEIRRQMAEHGPDACNGGGVELRVSLLDGGVGRAHVAIDLLLADARSIATALRELFECYGAPAKGLPAPALTFRDCIMSLEQYKKTEAYAADVAYWKQRCSNLPEGPKLPVATKPDAARSERFGATVKGTDVLRAHAARIGVSLSAVLLGAYMKVLAAWSDGSPFSVVMPCWQRVPLHPQIGEVVGDFTAMSWITSVEGSCTFEEVARRHDETLREDLSHRAVSGLKALRRVLGKRRQATPMFPVVFTDPVVRGGSSGLPNGFSQVRLTSVTPQVYLDNISADRDGVLSIHWDTRSGVYADGLVEAMLADYCKILQLLIADPRSWNRHQFEDVIGARAARRASSPEPEELATA